jgi:hypothetical protein
MTYANEAGARDPQLLFYTRLLCPGYLRKSPLLAFALERSSIWPRILCDDRPAGCRSVVAHQAPPAAISIFRAGDSGVRVVCYSRYLVF